MQNKKKKPFKTGETRNHFVQKGINKCRQHTCRKCKTRIYYLQNGQKVLSAEPEMSKQINLKLYLQKGLTRNRKLLKELTIVICKNDKHDIIAFRKEKPEIITYRTDKQV